MCTHNLDIAQHRDTLRYKLVHSGNWKPSHPPLQLKDFVILNFSGLVDLFATRDVKGVFLFLLHDHKVLEL